MSKLRPYQVMAIDSALAALSNSGSAVLQMPTGAGKTRAATEITKRWDGVVWFICHRQEIERQASTAFTAAGIDHGIVSPRGSPEYDRRVQVVSVATLARRIGDLPPPALVIWDECHHVAAKSWSAIREQISGAKHLGLTATPERLDGKGLAEWFAELVVGPSTRDLIDDEWLSDFRYFAPSEPDLTGAKLRAGDYRKEDVAKAMNVPVLIGDAIAEYRAKADGKRALVFCAGVEASKALVERFNAEGIPARHIDGTTSTSARDEAVAQLASGEIKVLSNVEVFTEGFDLPAIDAVILLRPTKSLALFLQMVGRVLRRAEGKSEALIFDHAGLWLEPTLGFPDEHRDWQLTGGSGAKAARRRVIGPRRCPECREVRTGRPPVCDCGYEFPSGREIGEYDGELREMRGAAPDGCETVAEFAGRVGVSRGAVRKWLLRGLPQVSRHPRITAGIEWVSKNIRVISQGRESQHQFSKRMSVASGTITDWIRRGLPVDDHKAVIVEDAIAWVNRNVRVIPEGHETISSFARRRGLSPDEIRPFIRQGMPYCKQGGVPIVQAERWLASRPQKAVVPEGCVTKKDFAERHGKNLSTVYRWVDMGLPNIDGNPITCDGDAWVSSKVLPPPVAAMGYERKSDFARRIGVRHQGTVSDWMARGLAADENGHPHIQRGLEWVRDNTSIQIPPEAWPSANDNDSAGDSAAA